MDFTAQLRLFRSEGRLEMTTIRRDGLGETLPIRTFSWPCTELDVLYLSMIFTTKGVHHIRASDELSSRLLIQNVLSSLQWYHQIAFISTADDQLDFADNIIARLPKQIDELAIETFFLEEFYYDFIWIELTQDLQKEQWLALFQEKLQSFQIDQIIPIVIIEYQ